MSPGGWRLELVDGILLIRCVPLLAVPSLAHAFSTRVGDGGPCFDMGPARARSRDEESRRERFVRAAGLAGRRPTVLEQMHGDRVVRSAAGPEPAPADGAIWAAGDPRESIPSVRSADCVPILLLAGDGGAAAAVHAGWRGTAAGVVERAVQALSEVGVEREGILAALGPAILGCCYEVGDEVADALSAAGCAAGVTVRSGGRTRADLHRANAAQLLRSGVPADRIHGAPWCTRCRVDLFFSHRRDREGAGRMIACVGAARRP